MDQIHKYKWGFSVLHYKTIEMTIQCVESLQNLYKDDVHLVIVDNGSKDGTAEILNDRYAGGDVRVIVSDENLGFSKGNNIGYMYLKDIGCDFIVLLNNDVIAVQDNFIDRIETEYENGGFDILGPMILNGKLEIVHTYPQTPVHCTISSIYIGQVTCAVKWLLSFCGLDMKLAELISERQRGKKEIYATQRCENVQISGCCIIFSKSYINKFDGLNPAPFLYLEEEILFARAARNSMKIVYSPEIRIVHIGEVATTETVGDSKAKKRRFRYWNQFKSFFALKEEVAGVKKNHRSRRIL